MTIQLNLPPTEAGLPIVATELEGHLTIVGANGSGKSRFGIWIEESNAGNRVIHRISAQKALNFPEYSPVKNPEEAEKELLYGRSDSNANAGNKRTFRWNNEPTSFMLNDYERVLSLLFAKDNERNLHYVTQARQGNAYTPVPDSPIDKIVRVWADMMPHRNITLESGKVLVNVGNGQYHGRHMSDGERVALYLLGQCVCAPAGSVVVIDEPELHMHKALMDKFWNRVEELCSDKTLVYITHDLDFAVTRRASRLLWVKSFNGSAWSWNFVDRNIELPDSLLLEVLGTRRPILFCEGERGGLDHVIYQLAYPHKHVIPRGSADKVVEATRALNSNGSLHPYQAAGIVDRDVKNASEVSALADNGIQTLDFAEIENVLCAEELVKLVAQHLLQDSNVVANNVQQYVHRALMAELELQAALRAERRIRYKLSCYTRTGNDEASLSSGLAALVGTIDCAAEFAEAKALLNNSLTDGLNSMLKVYNRKTIHIQIAPCFGLSNTGYKDLLVRLLNGNAANNFLEPLRSLLPAI